MVALTQAAYGLPMVIFSIFAGAVADTYDRRKTMIWALAFSICASALLAVAASFELLGSWSTLTLLFLVGIGAAIFTPSWQASLGTIADRDRLGEAVSLHNMGANVMRTVGPALGGFLVTFTSATFTFLVGALSYLPALIVLTFWKPQTTPVGATRESVTSAMAAGIRFLIASPAIQPIFLRVFCFSTSAISVMALLPLIVRDQFGGDATDYGILFGAFGLGAILGGFAQGLLRQRYDSEWMVRRAFLINASAIAVRAITNNFIVGLLATGLAGSCWLMSHSLQNTTLQLATPRWMVGRMVSICLTATFLGISAGSWLWGGDYRVFGHRVRAGRVGRRHDLDLATGAPLSLARNAEFGSRANGEARPLKQAHLGRAAGRTSADHGGASCGGRAIARISQADGFASSTSDSAGRTPLDLA